jgi:ribonuclease T1
MLSYHKSGICLLFALLIGIAASTQVQANHSMELAKRSHNAVTHTKIRSIETIAVGALPPEAKATLKLIKRGGPFPYHKDGTVFNNREGRLPAHKRGYYREYTVKTPGRRDRGARRIIAGADGEFYYTDDHYNTFRLIKE